MEKKLNALIKILIGVTFFVPLLVLPQQFIFPFIVPKILLFRSLVLLMLGGYILLLASNWQKYRVRWNYLNLAVGLFFVSFAISTFVGVDWYKSFWDNHERMLGLFTIFHYILYYYIATTVVTEWKEWKLLMRVFLGAGALVMIIGFFQKFVDPEFFLNKSNARVSATLGNAIYFSGYGVFLFAIGVLSMLQEAKYSAWWYYGLVTALFGFGGIFWGGTRGALLGVLVGIGVLLISYAIALKNNDKLRNTLRILTIVGVVVLSLLFVYRQTTFVRQIPLLGKLLNSSLQEGTGKTRALAWEIAIEAWQEKPILGWGPNNYYYSFNEYYKPEFLEHGWGETWFDNAHSVIFNTLAVQGAVGLLMYLGLFAVPIYLLWKAYQTGRISIHLAAVATAFLVAHLVGKAFVFDDPTSYLYFFFFLAMIGRFCQNKNEVESEKKGGRITGFMIGAVLLVVLIFIFSTNINPARANNSMLDTLKAFGTGQDFVSHYEKTIKIPSPHIDDIRNDFARTMLGPIGGYVQSGNTEGRDNVVAIYDLAYRELAKNRSLHPLDIRVHMMQAQMVQLGANLKQDPSLLFEAEQILEEALLKSPKRQQIQYMLSTIKYQLQKPEEAISLLRSSIENDPKIGEGWRRLATVYQALNRTDDTRALLVEAQERGVEFLPEDLEYINRLLAE